MCNSERHQKEEFGVFLCSTGAVCSLEATPQPMADIHVGTVLAYTCKKHTSANGRHNIILCTSSGDVGLGECQLVLSERLGIVPLETHRRLEEWITLQVGT